MRLVAFRKRLTLTDIEMRNICLYVDHVKMNYIFDVLCDIIGSYLGNSCLSIRLIGG